MGASLTALVLIFVTGIQSPLMTVIACAYTSEGFVIGADGLRVDPRTGQDVTSTAQKIFSIAHPDFHGVHAWAGASWLFSLGKEPFVVSEEARSAIKEFSGSPMPSLIAYVTRIGIRIYKRLLAYNHGTKWLNPDLVSQNNEIFGGMFVGYIDDRAWMVQISFPCINGTLLPPILNKVCEAPTEFIMFSASKSAWDDMQHTTSAPESLVEAAEVVRKYVQLCIDKRYEYEDCKNMGGYIHMAAVAPEKFYWVIPPKEIGKPSA